MNRGGFSYLIAYLQSNRSASFMKMKFSILHKICFVLLWWVGYCAWGEISIVSLNSLGRPMAYGVCDTTAAVWANGMVAFIAPIEERSDSTSNGFHASYLRIGGELRELFPGYDENFAQPPLNKFLKTTNIRLTANHDFSHFAIIVEYIEKWRTIGGYVVPEVFGTKLIVVDALGKMLGETKLSSDSGSVMANQCHVSFSDDGKLLVGCGQYLGLRLYDLPTTDLTSFTSLDVDYKTGTAVITGDGTKVFFPQDDALRRVICYVDTATGMVVDTGLTAESGLNDSQMAVNHDGSCVAFRKTASSLSVCSLEDGAWKETTIDGTQIRSPAVSADGRYVVYQTRGASYSQIMEYDCKKRFSELISLNDDGEYADADCTSPSISRDGSRIAFVSAASNLVSNCNRQPQVYMVHRERSSVTLKLKKGWNLCGMPLTLDEQSVELLKSEPACWGWSNGRFHVMESFQAGQGFWLYALEDKTLKLTGEEAEPMPLKHGWNLVMPSLYSSAETTICFGFDGKSYVKLSEEANRAQAAWVFY